MSQISPVLIEGLPSDLNLAVLKCLSPRDTLFASQVNRSWRSFIHNHLEHFEKKGSRGIINHLIAVKMLNQLRGMSNCTSVKEERDIYQRDIKWNWDVDKAMLKFEIRVEDGLITSYTYSANWGGNCRRIFMYTHMLSVVAYHTLTGVLNHTFSAEKDPIGSFKDYPTFKHLFEQSVENYEQKYSKELAGNSGWIFVKKELLSANQDDTFYKNILKFLPREDILKLFDLKQKFWKVGSPKQKKSSWWPKHKKRWWIVHWLGEERPIILNAPTRFSTIDSKLPVVLEKNDKNIKVEAHFKIIDELNTGILTENAHVMFLVYFTFDMDSFNNLRAQLDKALKLNQNGPERIIYAIIGLERKLDVDFIIKTKLEKDEARKSTTSTKSKKNSPKLKPVEPVKKGKKEFTPVPDDLAQSFAKELGGSWLRTRTMDHESPQMKQLFKKLVEECSTKFPL